jgi:hypothetical protein
MRDIKAQETSWRAPGDSNGEVLQECLGRTLSGGYAGVLDLRVEGPVVQDVAANCGSRVGNSEADGERDLIKAGQGALNGI